MSSYNPYMPGWEYQRQGKNVRGNTGEYQGHGSHKSGPHVKDGMENYRNGYVSPSHSNYNHNHLHETATNYPSYPYSDDFYNGTGSDMRYLIQMMSNLNQQLDTLTQLIAQNNQLLQSMHDQEDTKCVQGGGGGAVIVRM